MLLLLDLPKGVLGLARVVQLDLLPRAVAVRVNVRLLQGMHLRLVAYLIDFRVHALYALPGGGGQSLIIRRLLVHLLIRHGILCKPVHLVLQAELTQPNRLEPCLIPVFH